MYQNKLNDIIKFYKHNYKEIGKQESYKWEAVSHFQKHWDINAMDFYLMLKEALDKTNNLLGSGQYYPKKVILNLADKDPLRVKQMFIGLYDESDNLISRIEKFKLSADSLVELYFPNNTYKSYQDHRAVIAYLTLRYPHEYFLYKYQMYKHFAEEIDYNYKPKAGDVTNVLLFADLCNFIISKIENDKELLVLYKDRKEIFNDESLHLLAQDIIYSCQYYSGKSVLDNDKYERVIPIAFDPSNIIYEELTSKAINKKVKFKASKIDYEKRQKLNKKTGDLGELFVLEYEKAKVKSYGLKDKKVQQISKVIGDGLGYDILSYDRHGNEIYIEVKTTCVKKDTEFYITETELQRSIVDAHKFILYRVYDLNKEELIGKIKYRKGSLEDLCISPQLYSVKLSGEV